MKECICGGSLITQISAVKPEDFIEPKKADGTFEPIEKMNHFERQAFTVMMQFHSRAEELIEVIGEGHLKPNEIGKARVEARVLIAKRNTVEELMFFSIRDRLDHWTGRLDVSQGWKIIIPEEEEPSKLIEMLIQPGSPLASVLQEAVNKVLEAYQESHLPQFTNGVKVTVPGTGTFN